ncbi:MAG: hypothetical protein H8E63_05410 [Proteobacteria bacterium]|nr:hypothetical protein [Pseudomonadota bacterium]
MELRDQLAAYLEPACVTPVVACLASEACEEHHEIDDVGGGRYARIFVGL